ncbi:PAS domain S-box-containing protein [Friedmanniella luteola]|uniref:histidine kinase n=1 Tax=Friedmanniella luteola TaxID=546871 RepID=A0A1H1XC42_9ACTN|nr:PAS domain S-box-containing protein [Friedmanniella luteola]
MESHGRLQGSGAWRFGVFSAITGLVSLVLAALLSSDLPAEVRTLISGCALVGVGLTACISCRYRATRSIGLRRRAYHLWSLACLSAALGNLGLMLNGAQRDRQTISASDITLLATLLLAAAGVITFPLARRRGTDLVRMLLDGVVVGGSILAVVSIRTWSQVAAMDPVVAVVNLIAPVIDIVVATLATLLFMRSARGDRSVLGATAIGFTLYAISDLLYALRLVGTGSFELGTPVDLGWMAGYALIAWSVANASTPDARQDEGQVESSPVIGTATVFTVFLLAALLSLVGVEEVRVNFVSGVLWAVVLLAVLGRQFFLVIDNEQLRRTLEQRVVERTRSLRQVTRQSDLLVNSVGDGIYGVDRFGLITFVNPAAADALGYEALELIGHDAHATFHAPAPSGVSYPADSCYIVEAIRDGLVTSAEEDSYLRADGLEIPVEVTATPLTDDGATLGAVVVFRDVTQRREVDRLKNEFVSMVSHELRTPLTAIRGSLGLLAGGALGALTPAASRMVDIALVSSERLTRLINEILDLERMEAGALPMELHDLPAAGLVRTALEQASVLATEAGVALRVVHAEGVVRADEDRVVQTLLNLLGNAIKFSDPGQEVTVQSVRRGSFVEFEVSDSGRGIPEDKLDAVFARFQQVDSSDAREKGGSGLGLAISRSIVERLGGRIWARNNDDGGAAFRFTLPASLAAPHASPPRTAEAALQARDRVPDPAPAG